MKFKSTITLIALLFITCSKENNYKYAEAASQDDIEATVLDTAKIPLNDLRKKTFMGDTGGLYPRGRNSPYGKYASDLLEISQQIVPIDTFGNTSANGKIVFISIGGSTGGHNMKLLQLKTVNNPATNPKLKLMTCNNGTGDASLNSIMNPKASYWDHVTQILTGTKSSYRQVQVIYLETDDSTKVIGWPGRANLVKNSLEACMRVLKNKFPNIKVLYVLGRTRTFGSKALWNKEPSPYYFGWGCKWAIEDQINKVPGTEYKGKNAVAPIITWGFYQWADTIPRKVDGFQWLPSQTVDGLHASPAGQDTLATRFQNFLLTDQYASIWYAAH